MKKINAMILAAVIAASMTGCGKVKTSVEPAQISQIPVEVNDGASTSSPDAETTDEPVETIEPTDEPAEAKAASDSIGDSEKTENAETSENETVESPTASTPASTPVIQESASEQNSSQTVAETTVNPDEQGYWDADGNWIGYGWWNSEGYHYDTTYHTAPSKAADSSTGNYNYGENLADAYAYEQAGGQYDYVVPSETEQNASSQGQSYGVYDGKTLGSAGRLYLPDGYSVALYYGDGYNDQAICDRQDSACVQDMGWTNIADHNGQGFDRIRGFGVGSVLTWVYADGTEVKYQCVSTYTCSKNYDNTDMILDDGSSITNHVDGSLSLQTCIGYGTGRRFFSFWNVMY